ncbi:MAG: hypothetical protein ACREKH_01940, partial [Candidatus Rokuibacteriota bacterium]
MRARLVALVLAGSLLAPLPAMAAPERADSEASSWTVDGLLSRLAGSISRLFGATDGDLGATVDPDGLAAPPSPSSGDEEGDGDHGPTVD